MHCSLEQPNEKEGSSLSLVFKKKKNKFAQQVDFIENLISKLIKFFDFHRSKQVTDKKRALMMRKEEAFQ